MTPQDKQQLIVLCEYIIKETGNEEFIERADNIEIKILSGEKLDTYDRGFLSMWASQCHTDTLGRFDKSIYKVLTIV